MVSLRGSFVKFLYMVFCGVSSHDFCMIALHDFYVVSSHVFWRDFFA